MNFSLQSDLPRRLANIASGVEPVNLEIIEETIEHLEKYREQLPTGNPGLPFCLTSLAAALMLQYDKLQNPDRLEHFIEIAQLAVNIVPLRHPCRALATEAFSQAMYLQYKQSKTGQDLECAITSIEAAIALVNDDLSRIRLAGLLSETLRDRNDLTGSPGDLLRAMDLAKMVLKSTPVDDTEYYPRFTTVTLIMAKQAMQTKAIEDLDIQVEHLEAGIGSLAGDDPRRIVFMGQLSSILEIRFQQTAVNSDIDRAIILADRCVAFMSNEHNDYHENRPRFQYIYTLVNALMDRYLKSASLEDINRAVEWAKIGEQTTSPNSSERADATCLLAKVFKVRFTGIGNREDLDRAIEFCQSALQMTACSEHTLAQTRGVLAVALSSRFRFTNSLEDLDLSINLNEAITSQGLLENDPRYLVNLGTGLIQRFSRTQNGTDLDKAIELMEAARDESVGESIIASSLVHLGICWVLKFEDTGLRQHLDNAIEIYEIALVMTPEGHSERSARLMNLASAYKHLFEKTRDLDFLSRSIDLSEESISIPTSDIVDRTDILCMLGDFRLRRETPGDDDRALSCYLEGWECTFAKPLSRIEAAVKAAKLLALRSSWNEASDLLQQCVELVPLISTLSLQNSDKQHVLSQCSELASDAAAAALIAGKNPEEALRILELGRGLISSLLLEVRTDISDLRQEYPSLASKLDSVRDELDLPSSSMASLEACQENSLFEVAKLERRHEAQKTYVQVCQDIRELPGFERFLLPPTSEEFKLAANQGPIVVVNVSRWRCDAWIIEESHIRALPLPELHHDGLLERRLTLSHSTVVETLQFLWDAVALPIFHELGIVERPNNEAWQHIWWIPTGPLTLLPLHAAGNHSLGSSDTVLDRVVSSYSSSVKAIVYCRQQRSPEARVPQSNRKEAVSGQALLIAMQHTPQPAHGPSISALPYAEEEIREVASLCPSLGLQIIMPPKRKADCLSAIKDSTVFHYAGHGHAVPYDPSQSSLLLEDWRTNLFTVANVRDSRLQESSPFLAYLSACSTGTVLNAMLLDENIHMVSAFQLSGFRHVVGTLWEVADKYCVDVAKNFYEALIVEGGMTDRAVSWALHRAVRALRDSARGMTVAHDAKGNILINEQTQDGVTQGSTTGNFQFGSCNANTQSDADGFHPNASCPEPEAMVISTPLHGDNESQLGVHVSIEGGTRASRDAVYVEEVVEELNPMYWAPYVHFGV